ncbi:hypothetical protein HDU98_011784 [Podochytrium sp. JEL0797]|nr:hypothetical protein HDU98_011784 [Podochytrium sp. JEL0797]
MAFAIQDLSDFQRSWYPKHTSYLDTVSPSRKDASSASAAPQVWIQPREILPAIYLFFGSLVGIASMGVVGPAPMEVSLMAVLSDVMTKLAALQGLVGTAWVLVYWVHSLGTK